MSMTETLICDGVHQKLLILEIFGRNCAVNGLTVGVKHGICAQLSFRLDLFLRLVQMKTNRANEKKTAPNWSKKAMVWHNM